MGTDANCGQADGEATVTAIDGTPPYTYLWDTNASSQTTSTATNLAAGTYNVTVTDDNNCTFETSATINDASGPTASTSQIDALCDEANGTATVTAFNGNPPYMYLWNDATASTTATISNLAAGTYNVTVTDGVGCLVTESVTIGNSPAPTAMITVVDATCGELIGEATVTASGGDGSYNYLWDANAGNSTNATVTGLDAGIYSVTVTDGNSCTVETTATIMNTPTLDGTIDVTDANCGLSDGSAIVNATGGTPPFTYTWSSPIPSGTAETATNLLSGTYSVTVTDFAGCTISAPIVIADLSLIHI